MRLIKFLLTLAIVVALLAGGAYVWRTISGKTLGKDEGTVVQDGSLVTTAPVEAPVAKSDGIGFTVTINEAQGASVVEKALEQKLEVSKVALNIGEDKLRVSGTAGRDSIVGMIEEEKGGLPEAIKGASKLLPEDIDFTILLSAVADGSGGVSITPESFGLAGFSVGASFLPDTVINLINNGINGYISEYVGKITSLDIGEGEMTVSGEFTAY